MMIKDLGARVERVWQGLRPLTKKMLVRAMQTNLTLPKANFSYDVHADWELSQLLSALDEQASDSETKKNTQKFSEINQLAETVVDVLEEQSESAEVFIQLAERALKRRDYQQIDKLSDALVLRFSVGEICEIVRQTENPVIRTLGLDTLPLMPTNKLVDLLDDPLYDEIARGALEQQAFEYELERARQVIDQLDFADESKNQ